MRSGRGHRLTLVGGWLNTVAALAMGFNAIGFAPTALAQLSDRSATVHAVDLINSSPALVPLLVLLSVGLLFPIGQGIGLARAGVFGWWYVGLTVVVGGRLPTESKVPFWGRVWVFRSVAHHNRSR